MAVCIACRRIGRVATGDRVEQQGCIGDRASHRTGSVLARADGHHMGAADHADGRLETDNTVHAGGARDRSVCLGADRCPRHARRHRRAAARRRSAWVPVGGVGVPRLPTDRAPATGGIPRTDVRPLAEIGLAENYPASRPQARYQRRITASPVVGQRQASRRGGPFARLDVVLHQYRAPGEWAYASLRSRGLFRLGIVHDDRVKAWACVIERFDTLDMPGGIFCRPGVERRGDKRQRGDKQERLHRPQFATSRGQHNPAAAHEGDQKPPLTVNW